MKFPYGATVIETRWGYKGIIIGRYEDYASINPGDPERSEEWLSLQDKPFEYADRLLPWYKILTCNGGSIQTSENYLEVTPLTVDEIASIDRSAAGPYFDQALADIATFSMDDAEANKAMAVLRKYNKTYHWCPEWDDLVICDEDKEYKVCLCEKATHGFKVQIRGEEYIEIIKDFGRWVTTVEGKKYLYMPFWIETTSDPTEVILYSLDRKLPKDLEEAIKKMRG